MTYFDRPSLLQIPNAPRASSSSTSISSDSSYGFDRRSKVSQLTDQTPLITPVDSVDSIFGNGPEPQPAPCFPDLIAWDGLTDEQWKLHSLVYKAERAIQAAEKWVQDEVSQFDTDICDDDDLYGPDDGFDAVAAVRTRLVKGEQTKMTRRALEIIDGRSGIEPTLIEDKNSEYDEHSMARKDVVEVEEVEDYADDFELDDGDVLEIPANPHTSSTHGRHSLLDAIEDSESSREPDSLFNVTFPSPFLFATDTAVPPTPLIRPVDVVWDRPSFSSFDTSASSTPNFISQLMMSPLVLNNPAASTSSPAIFRNALRNIDPRSPIVSISSFMFSSRLPLPKSLLDEALDIPEVVEPEVLVGLGNFELPQESGLGFVDIPSPKTQGVGTWTRTDQGSFFGGSDGTKVTTPGNISESSSGVGSPANSRDPGLLCVEFGSPFEPPRSPWDILVEGLSQSAVPYVPLKLGSTIDYTGLATNVGFDGGNTVTAGSNHPAASASFIASTNEDSKAGKKAKGLGLRLPTMGLKQRVSRCSSGIPRSEACQDLASLASSAMETSSDSLFRFRGHTLSPIAEEAPQPNLCRTFTLESTAAPSPRKRRNFFKRILRRFLSWTSDTK